MYLRALFLLILCVVVGSKNVNPSELMSIPCKCVPQHMCIDNNSTLTGAGYMDIRLFKDECENVDDICCDNIAEYEKTIEEEPEYPSTQSLFNTCGFETKLIPRILGNKKISFGQVPWMAAILIKDEKSKFPTVKCGCSLIHPQVVMTAAHCVFRQDATSLIIRAGQIDMKDESPELPHQDRLIKEVIIHHRFEPHSLKNDIALIVVNEPFMLSGNVRTICLPSRDMKSIANTCQASGWGVSSFSKIKQSTVLKKVKLPLVRRSECIAKLRGTRLGTFFTLHRSFMCAGGEEGRDTCTGDGGSPLVCPMSDLPNRFIQMGIVSWGIGCGTDIPGVYVNVNLFSGWIDKELLKRYMDINVYKYD